MAIASIYISDFIFINFILKTIKKSLGKLAVSAKIIKFLPQPANNVDYFHFKFHQNRIRFNMFFLNLFIHSLWIVMCFHWISDHLTSTFKTSIIQKLFRAGHWFFQWCLMILKSNFSKNFSQLGVFSEELWPKEVSVWVFFCHSYCTT